MLLDFWQILLLYLKTQEYNLKFLIIMFELLITLLEITEPTDAMTDCMEQSKK